MTNAPSTSYLSLNKLSKVVFSKNTIDGLKGGVAFHGMQAYPTTTCEFNHNFIKGVSTMLATAGLEVSHCGTVTMIGNEFRSIGAI